MQTHHGLLSEVQSINLNPLEVAPCVRAEMEFDELGLRADVISDSINNLYETADEETKKAMDALAKHVGDDPSSNDIRFLDVKEDDTEAIVYLKTVFSELGPLLRNIEKKEVELDEFSAEKSEILYNVVYDIEQRLDYDKVVDEILNQDNYGIKDQVGLVIRARKLLETVKTSPYGELRKLEEIIQKFVEDWEDKDILRSEAKVREERNTPILSSKETVECAQQQIDEAEGLMVRYRSYDRNSPSPGRDMMRDLYRVHIVEPSVADKDLNDVIGRPYGDTNDDLLIALERAVAKRVAELPSEDYDLSIDGSAYKEFVQKAREINVDEALKNIEVTGEIASYPFAFTKDDLLDYLRKNMIPFELAVVKRIEFRELTADEDKEGETVGSQLFNDATRESVVIISTQKFVEYFEEMRKELIETTEEGEEPIVKARFKNIDAAEEFAKGEVKKVMLETLAHEFGHTLHHAVPVAALKRWHDAKITDPVNVTEYVKKKVSGGHEHADMEDFSESKLLFIHEPEVLDVISRTRFDGMRTLFEEFMPEFGSTLKKEIAKKIMISWALDTTFGIPLEVRRAYHLQHEASPVIK